MQGAFLHQLSSFLAAGGSSYKRVCVGLPARGVILCSSWIHDYSVYVRAMFIIGDWYSMLTIYEQRIKMMVRIPNILYRWREVFYAHDLRIPIKNNRENMKNIQEIVRMV